MGSQRRTAPRSVPRMSSFLPGRRGRHRKTQSVVHPRACTLVMGQEQARSTPKLSTVSLRVTDHSPSSPLQTLLELPTPFQPPARLLPARRPPLLTTHPQILVRNARALATSTYSGERVPPRVTKLKSRRASHMAKSKVRVPIISYCKNSLSRLYQPSKRAYPNPLAHLTPRNVSRRRAFVNLPPPRIFRSQRLPRTSRNLVRLPQPLARPWLRWRRTAAMGRF